MIDTNQYVKTHELYTQFNQWLGVDGKVDSNYFMINYSLHAATSYIKKYHNIDLELTTVFEKVSKNTIFSPTHIPTKVINVFKSGKLSYPTISYIDTSTFSLETIEGEYNSDMDFGGSPEEFYSTYLTGYVYSDTSDYSDIDFEDEYKLPSPRVQFGHGQSVKSPQNVYSNDLNVTIIGTPSSKIFIDNVEVGVLDLEGKYLHTRLLVQEATTITVKLQDPLDENITSLEVKELFILTSYIPNPYLHVVGQTYRTNVKEAIILVATPVGCDIDVNGVVTTATSLITTITTPITTLLSSSDVVLTIKATLNGKESVVRHVKVEYNTSFDPSYISELNKMLDYIPYLPEDLLIAVFKLANHFYNGTLYNNSNVDSFRTVNDISQTYTSHSIPSDIKVLLGTYTYYKP